MVSDLMLSALWRVVRVCDRALHKSCIEAASNAVLCSKNPICRSQAKAFKYSRSMPCISQLVDLNIGLKTFLELVCPRWLGASASYNTCHLRQNTFIDAQRWRSRAKHWRSNSTLQMRRRLLVVSFLFSSFRCEGRA